MMLCQACSSENPLDAELCGRCGHKLLIVSGDYTEDDQEAFDTRPTEQGSLDEHLLERISILEEVLRRTTDSMRQSLGSLYTLEQKILVNETGLSTLRDLLEAKGLISRQEWSELWEMRMDRQLLALEKREHFTRVREAIHELFAGERRERFEELLAQADHALLGLDIDTAMEILEEAHDLDPSNFELSFFLGETCFNEGKAAAALTFFTRVLAVRPRHFESLVYSGVLCHEQGTAHRAEDLLKRAVAFYPDSFLPAFSLGAVYVAAGSFNQAATLLEQAVTIEDAMPQAQYLLGTCCFEMGRLGDAIERLTTATRQDPTFVEAYHLLGLALLDSDRPQQALTAFQLAQRLRPGRLEYEELVQFLRSELGSELGSEPGSEADTSDAAGSQAGGAELTGPGLTDESRHWLSRAEDALRAGQGREALSAYRRAVAQDENNPTLLVAYAMACLELQRSDEIEPALDRVFDMRPGERLEAVAYATWIEALRADGRIRESNRLGLELLEQAETDFGRTVAHFELACNLAEMGEALDDALDHAHRAVDTSPPALVRFPLAVLGWVHLKRQEIEPAVDCLTRSNALGSSARSLTQLGIALLAAERYAAARDALSRARSLEEHRGGLQAAVFDALAGGARLLQETPRTTEP